MKSCVCIFNKVISHVYIKTNTSGWDTLVTRIVNWLIYERWSNHRNYIPYNNSSTTTMHSTKCSKTKKSCWQSNQLLQLYRILPYFFPKTTKIHFAFSYAFSVPISFQYTGLTKKIRICNFVTFHRVAKLSFIWSLVHW